MKSFKTHIVEYTKSQVDKRRYDDHQRKLAPIAKARNAAKKSGKPWAANHPKEKEYYRLKQAMGESVVNEMSHKDLSPKYRGISTSELIKRSNDNRKYSPAERKNLKAEINARDQVREDTQLDELSVNTLKSYRDKADDDVEKKQKAAVKAGPYSDKGKKLFSKAQSRNNSLATAAHKIHQKTKSQGTPAQARKRGWIANRRKLHTENAIAGAPGNNTSSGPGMGSDSSLKLKKARLFKDIYRRHGTTKEGSYKGVPKGNR